MLFKKKRQVLEGISEQRFDDMMSLIKDLPKADYARLKEAMDLGYNAYQKVKNVKTKEEKMVEDIEKVEEDLENGR